VTALNSSAIQISWSSPADSQRYGVIKEYLVTYLATTPRSPAVKVHVPANARENEPDSPPAYYELVVNSLAPYTMYEVAVTALQHAPRCARKLPCLTRRAPWRCPTSR
jgi:hypothetical protein